MCYQTDLLLSNLAPYMQLQNLGHNLNGHGIAILVGVTAKPFMFMQCDGVYTNHPNKTGHFHVPTHPGASEANVKKSSLTDIKKWCSEGYGCAIKPLLFGNFFKI